MVTDGILALFLISGVNLLVFSFKQDVGYEFFSKLSPEDMLIDFRERRREGEREGKKH